MRGTVGHGMFAGWRDKRRCVEGGGEGEGGGDKLGVGEMSGERLWWRVVYGRIRGGGVFGSAWGKCVFFNGFVLFCFISENLRYNPEKLIMLMRRKWYGLITLRRIWTRIWPG